MITRRVFALGFALAVWLLSPVSIADAPDWNALADESVIEVLTHDADGDLRETTVWVGVVDGVGFVRTSDTRWRENIARDADVVVRIAEQEYPLRAELVTDDALRARVNQVFRAKYGLTDRILGWFGNEGGKYQLALRPRPASPEK
jgi:hypothetical protein